MISALSKLSDPARIDAICLDMDGVLADLYSVPDWRNKLEDQDAAPYDQARPMEDMSRLDSLICDLGRLGVATYILSWGAIDADPGYEHAVEAAKRRWLARYLPSVASDRIHVMPYGTDKASALARRASWPLLFDDEEGNCKSWPGEAMHVRGEEGASVVAVLEELIGLVSDLG